MTVSEPDPRHMEWLLEQIAAAKEMIHTYTCFHCHMATATHPLIIIVDEPEGARVTVLPICDTCIEEEKGDIDERDIH